MYNNLNNNNVNNSYRNQSLDNNIHTASIVLECISSLCDGQHREMQRYLHDQEQSLRVRMCLRA